MADRMEEIGVRPDIQERRQAGMWELSIALIGGGGGGGGGGEY